MVAVASSGFAATVGKAAVAAPSAPSWDILVTDWSLDVAFPFVVVLAALYVIGVRRLHAHGRSWPSTRPAAFLPALGGVLAAPDAGVAAAGRLLYALRGGQHRPPAL